MTTAHNLAALRAHLFGTIADVRAKRIDLDSARAVNDLAKTLTDTARVEVDFIRATERHASEFLESTTETRELPGGTVRVVQHRMKG